MGCAVIPAAMLFGITSNLSSAIIVCGIVFVMTFVVYPNYWVHGGIIGIIMAGYIAGRQWLKQAVENGVQFKKFRFTRLLVWVDPEKYIDGKGYQTMQGLYAIGSGGLFGKGLGKSMQKLGFIPESQNDMIFSIICEELGLFGAACVIMLFIIMLWRIIYISQNSPDLFGSLLAVGIFAHIAIQVIVNIAVVTNVFPNTGVTLPFISYGGTASLFLLAELGIVAALIAACAAVYFGFRTDKITYVGNSHYSNEEMTNRIFGNDTPNTVLYTLFGNKKKTIPFIQKYDVEIQWPRGMYITVYEKAVIGYIRYMGCNMYFDKDGIVVESSTETFEKVPEIIGLKFNSIVLDSKLEVGDDEVFRHILDLTQSFDKYNLDVSKVYFDSSDNVILYIDEVKVYLGKSDDYTDKLFELKQMETKFAGLKGSLYMQDYTKDSSSIIFKKDEYN